MVIHSPAEVPLIEEEGLDLKPGTASRIGLKVRIPGGLDVCSMT